MTPQEKAKFLLSKHALTILSKIGHKLPMEEVKEIAKESIFIEVNEIIEVLKEVADEEVLAIHVIYWNKVKQETEAL